MPTLRPQKTSVQRPPSAIVSPPVSVLRVGLVRGGRVVHERLVRAGEAVTVGDEPRATLHIADLPGRFTLFQTEKGEFRLRVRVGLEGRLATTAGTRTLDALIGEGHARREREGWTLPLGPRTRGKVVLGTTTVLFQIIPSPPIGLKWAKAADFRPRLLDEDDPIFLGFTGLFSALAALLLVYAWSVPPQDLSDFEEVKGRVASIYVEAMRPVDIAPLEIEEVVPALEPAPVADPEPVVAAKDSEVLPDRPLTARERAAADAAAAQRQVEDVTGHSALLTRFKQLGSKNEFAQGSGGSVFGGEDILGQSLDDYMKDVHGTDIAGLGGVGGYRGGETGTRGDVELGELERSEKRDVSVARGPETDVTVRTDWTLKDPPKDERLADLIRQVVRANKPQIDHCYEIRLRERPRLGGRLEFLFSITNGRVGTIRFNAVPDDDEQLQACVDGRVSRWRFPSEVSYDEVKLPFVLEPSNP